MDMFLLEAMLKSFAIILLLMALIPLAFFLSATAIGLLIVGVVKTAMWVKACVRKLISRGDS